MGPWVGLGYGLEDQGLEDRLANGSGHQPKREGLAQRKMDDIFPDKYT